MMESTSTLSLCSHPKVSFGVDRSKHGLLGQYYGSSALLPAIVVRLRRRNLIARASSSSSSGQSAASADGSRKVYPQSQLQTPVSAVPASSIATYVVPAGVILVGCFADSFVEIDWEEAFVKIIEDIINREQV